MADINIGKVTPQTYESLPEFVASRNFTAFDYLVDTSNTEMIPFIRTKPDGSKVVLKGSPVFTDSVLVGLAMNTVDVTSGGAMVGVMTRGSVYSERLPFALTAQLIQASDTVMITPREGEWKNPVSPMAAEINGSVAKAAPIKPDTDKEDGGK